MKEDKRPEWGHKISESAFKKISSVSVTRITHHWHFTSADTSEHWIEFHAKEGKGFRPASGWEKYFEFSPSHNALISPTYWGREASKDLEKISNWEAKNKREIAQYKRLKEKFKDTA